ncbi:hypothetical protein CRM22_006284 [Opisthorchis felineus]|uniref:glutathione-specific gamma-glutamylcyclotransferase n=1 Tax=Opisthorchis felineus TaxID=147828 RepID=A0A4V3SEH4_OPIFE|nr:hypothetical protein CRM22_006284 [Opisthorchis felineus]
MPPNAVYRDNDSVIVFGYGSLIWMPNFPYSQRIVGYVRGYKRRFYQGNVFHRGTPERPGRVATLLRSANPDTRVWGCAYEVTGSENIDIAFEHLNHREVINGGYQFTKVQFNPEPSKCFSNAPMEAWVCVHLQNRSSDTTSNERFSVPNIALYLGKAPIEVQASEIARAHGVCGSNSEYVFQLANFMRNEVPLNDALKDDRYIFELENLVRIKI